ncbi:hypothetical protein [Cohnella luojiensis]|uniref:Uncharacterized protein n=1 Tax=Cohnella luojiensis TaxID=652876 RepID=A0A4Y8M1A4_9BACL|nr:hypothetical protein [Cohnella luojiensis]TFE27859.1 hypothetical protein E2980_08740 [Cohnella luojiensis]
MNRLDREWEIKLRLIGAISRSQEALAKILESVADVTGTAGVAPETLHEHVRVLTGMQGALLRTVSGTSWRPPVRGKPASPWLSDRVRSCDRNAGGVSN